MDLLYHCKLGGYPFIIWSQAPFAFCRSTIRDKIIPRAVSWFTGEAMEAEDFEIDGDEEDDIEEDDEEDEEDEDDEEDDDDEDEEDEEESKTKKKV